MMGDQFIGEIRMVGFNFAPAGWALCDGSLLPISQNQALFALLGVMFGGNGTTTINHPDLQGRAPMGMGNGPSLTPIAQGQLAGSENVNLSSAQMPMHTHAVNVAGVATDSINTPSTTNNVQRTTRRKPSSATNRTTTQSTPEAQNPAQDTDAGGSQPLPIRNPY